MPITCRGIPRGTPAASLKLPYDAPLLFDRSADSAGNSRGLIEAMLRPWSTVATCARIPRGTPAASLKPPAISPTRGRACARIPRGTPAASLKHVVKIVHQLHQSGGIPRGTPAASLKPRAAATGLEASFGIPRGTPAASLKRAGYFDSHDAIDWIPRGTPAASLKPFFSMAHASRCGVDSAGNSRGLIEAAPCGPHTECYRSDSAGNSRGLIEARRSRSVEVVCVWIPRGTPAASLKQVVWHSSITPLRGIPRGTPAASLKQTWRG